MGNPELTGILVRVPQGRGPALASASALAAAGVGFDFELLFTVGSVTEGVGFRASVQSEWHLARPKSSMAGANPWDIAHEAMAGIRLGFADDEVFIEPDLLQDWPYPLQKKAGLAAGDVCQFEDQIPDLPRVPGRFAWHQGNAFSALREARLLAGQPTANGRIRIVHLDTGYDRTHSTFPAHWRESLQRNFIDRDRPNDASDRGTEGLLKNPGHGTGTLSILAGNWFRWTGNGYAFEDFVGGAPEAEIIPVRVGRSVVQLLTSSVAAGINYAAELCGNESTRVHVISMSMGGVASQAWADAVNKAYEAGIVYVAAAGNNFSAGFFGVPTRFIVYPARFRRVIAACGVMADARPYYGLPFGKMQGCWGPASKMATAMAAYTPNVPWAKWGCPGIVDMDGQGTSSATPQIAAAAALYLQEHASVLFNPGKYPEPWMRVEAVRQALFGTANKSADGGSSEKLGNGVLQAAQALRELPADASMLRQTPRDSAAFSFLRAVTGLGMVQPGPAEQMLALEATQLAQEWNNSERPNPLETAVADPDLPPESIPLKARRDYLEALLEHPRASKKLKAHIKQNLGRIARPQTPRPEKKRRPQTIEPLAEAEAAEPETITEPPAFAPRKPPFRCLRGYAIDPSLSTKLETAPVSEVIFKVPWEDLKPGPVGEYLEVIDIDPGSGCSYEPVDLDHPLLLAQNGLPPSEGTPQFHQQMVYAAASLTIRNFERALGRRALWRPGPSPDPKNEKNDSHYVQRLRVHPHALRERNAYYSPQKVGLLFGYFRAAANGPGEHMAGGMVFTCLSHDIIAHEVTHALLDGMNRCFLRPTNPDVLAFHEAFSDIVALFQHFVMPEILRHQIASTRGAIRSQQNLLGSLAGQFARGTGMRGALRDAIGTMQHGRWRPHQPDPKEYERVMQPHARGAILVAAVFDAFLSIYERRTADLVRLATGGTGVMQPGAIHPDLVERLANEGAKAAQHVLTMCIRALDYLPPVDVTFGEFLRAIITADRDLVEDDDLNYRVAFIDAFRRRGIYPRDVPVLSPETLLWQGPHDGLRKPSPQFENGLIHLRGFANELNYTESREAIFHSERQLRREIHHWLQEHFATNPQGSADAACLGLDPKGGFEVRSARFACRTSPDGGMCPQLLLTLLQQKHVPVDPSDLQGGSMRFEGGCTVVADLRECRIRYCIRKSLESPSRVARQQQFAMNAQWSAGNTYFDWHPLDSDSEWNEPFAAMHRSL